MRTRWAIPLVLAVAAPLRAAEGVPAWREVRIAAVIPDGAEEGAALHTRLGVGFEAQWRERGAPGPRVNVVNVDASEAASLLEGRRCDAVVVLGGERPDALRRVAERTFAGSLGRAFGFRPAYLVLGRSDGGRAESLVAAFPGALRSFARGTAGGRD